MNTTNEKCPKCGMNTVTVENDGGRHCRDCDYAAPVAPPRRMQANKLAPYSVSWKHGVEHDWTPECDCDPRCHPVFRGLERLTEDERKRIQYDMDICGDIIERLCLELDEKDRLAGCNQRSMARKVEMMERYAGYADKERERGEEAERKLRELALMIGDAFTAFNEACSQPGAKITTAHIPSFQFAAGKMEKAWKAANGVLTLREAKGGE